MLAVELREISKSFDGTQALREVSFSIPAGEVTALVGENGAGKSTLLRIMSGVIQADSGQLLIFDQRVHFSSPKDAQRAGIAIIHQELSTVPDLTVAENVFLDRLPQRGVFVDWRRLHAECGLLLQRLGVDVDPRTRVGDLALARQQMVKIGHARQDRARGQTCAHQEAIARGLSGGAPRRDSRACGTRRRRTQRAGPGDLRRRTHLARRGRDRGSACAFAQPWRRHPAWRRSGYGGPQEERLDLELPSLYESHAAVASAIRPRLAPGATPRDWGLQTVGRQAQDPQSQLTPGDPLSLGRQSAEGGPGQMVGAEAAAPHPRRADARR